jgi:rubrerythrin
MYIHEIESKHNFIAARWLTDTSLQKQKALTTRMNERVGLIQKTIKTLPASPQMKVIKATMEQETTTTRMMIKNETTFVDDTARLMVSIYLCYQKVAGY